MTHPDPSAAMPLDAEVCPACDGSGTYDGSLLKGAPPCPRCGGRGWILEDDAHV